MGDNASQLECRVLLSTFQQGVQAKLVSYKQAQKDLLGNEVEQEQKCTIHSNVIQRLRRLHNIRIPLQPQCKSILPPLI